MTGMAVRAGGRRVPDHLLGALRRTVAAHADPPLLRRRLEEDGYLYLPAVLDGKRVLAARREVFGRLAEVGEIRRPAADGIATGTSRRAELIDDPGAFLRSVCEGAAIRAVTHGAPLHQIMTAALDAPARAFDFLWLRTMAVGRASPLHFDHVYMNRGSRRVLSAWMSLGAVPPGDGPLMIVAGSHRWDDLIAEYRGHDVERSPGRPGALPDDPIDLAQDRDCQLLTADFGPGDVVVFGMFTLHGSFDNDSAAGRVRLCCDVRYQPEEDAVDRRWFGPDPPGHGGQGYGALSAAQPLTAPPLCR